MTIKEAEERTGLARANIRYYEEQRFFSPARGENGYRDYSEQDINTLLKIKLLRQLGFSLEEIRALQRGEQSLDSALARRERGLEGERQELDQAVRLCRDIRADGADFYTLDARLYLDRLDRVESGERGVLFQDVDPVRIFPWRRYFARTLDLLLCQSALTLTLQLTLRFNMTLQGAVGDVFLTLGALVILAAAETLLLHFTGTTPGKALLGLKILREDGSYLGLGEAARRTGTVIFFFGLSQVLIRTTVPLLVLIGAAMLIWACWQVYHEKSLPWEGDQLYLEGSTRKTGFWEKKGSWARAAGYLAAWAACIGLTVGGHYLASMPPHRGPELTVEQFVENYNRFLEFSYGKENLSYYLTEQGSFQEIDQEDSPFVIHVFGESPVPRASFRFTQDSGVLTQVTLTQSYERGDPLPKGNAYAFSLPYEEIAAAARSFLWGAVGYNGAAELYRELSQQHGSLHWERAGAAIDSTVRFSGYALLDNGLLWAQEGTDQSYFAECTMRVGP